ncbi:XisI protein [uncultured Thiothrix sp.]|uniref:XisI protein n=1 Tax=uncultured Thiothrix sp. TaxID=223185 RepID=UPI0026117995|nr:XisI protein [uncultured Thiothrix sp.]
MDKLKKYREAVKYILKDYASLSPSTNEVTTQLLFDNENDHYQLMYVGWQNGRRIYGAVIHMDIMNGKVWLQYNGTEEDLAQSLLDQGVEREDIVFGFKPVSVRKHTGFATI